MTSTNAKPPARLTRAAHRAAPRRSSVPVRLKRFFRAYALHLVLVMVILAGLGWLAARLAGHAPARGDGSGEVSAAEYQQRYAGALRTQDETLLLPKDAEKIPVSDNYTCYRLRTAFLCYARDEAGNMVRVSTY